MNNEEFEKSLKENVIVKIQKKHFIDFVKNHYNYNEYFDYNLKYFKINKFQLDNLLDLNNQFLIRLTMNKYITKELLFDLIFFKIIIKLKNNLNKKEDDFDILFDFMLDLNWNWEWIMNTFNHPFEIYLKNNVINKSSI